MPAGGKRPGAGRPKGVPNKLTALLKDAILKAAELAGEDGKGKNGMVGYLTAQASANPGPFMTLLGKVLPIQNVITGADGGPIETKDVTRETIVSEVDRLFTDPTNGSKDGETVLH